MLVKFSPAGKVLMTIGRREDPVAMLSNMPGAGAFHGRNAKYRFGRQTDVAFDQQGNIFVSDGYFDARVVKYDKNGRFIKAVGTRGNGNLQFNTPHSIATDFQGNVYVGDRGNARVQVLDNDLNWKANYTNVGNPWAVCVSGGPGTEEPRQAVSLRLELLAGQRAGGRRRVHRRGLQDGARRHDRRQVRPRRQGRRRVRDDPPDGLPRSRRHLHRRDQQLALAEDPAEAREPDDAARSGSLADAQSRPGAAGASLAAQTAVPEIAFDTNADLLKTPTDIYVGEVAGVGANSKGQIFVYTRTGHPYATLGDNRTFSRGGSRLFQFDPAGKFVRELGQDVYGFNAAIGLRVDPQDNVWTIDAAANQVVKFDPEGRVALVLGRKPEAIAVRPAQPAAGGGGAGAAAAAATGRRDAGAGTPGSSFSRPADVAWDRAGNIYVADGIGTNNRVAKFDKDGRFIKHWGSTGTGPGPVQRREGDRDRRAGQRLRRRRRQQADPGVRRRRARSSRSSATSARRSRCA